MRMTKPNAINCLLFFKTFYCSRDFHSFFSYEKNKVFLSATRLQTHNMNLLGYLFKCTQNNLDS